MTTDNRHQETHHQDGAAPQAPEDRVHEALTHLKEWVPSQGPIGVFVHHNTLHHFEHLPFEKAVEDVGRTVGAEPYLRHGEYLAAWCSGRILDEAVRKALRTALGPAERATSPLVLPRDELFYAVLQIPMARHSEASLTWLVYASNQAPFDPPRAAEGQAATPPSPLWRAALPLVTQRVNQVVTQNSPWFTPSHEDPLRTYLPDAKELARINALSIALLSAYLDQGISHWEMPRAKGAGLWASVHPFFAPTEHAFFTELNWPAAQSPLWKATAQGPVERGIAQLLTALGVPEALWSDFILRDTLHTASWAGLAGMLEENASLFPGRPRLISLAEVVALRLGIHLAVRATRSPLVPASRPSLAPGVDPGTVPTLTYQVLALSQIAGFSASALQTMPEPLFESLVKILWEWGDVPRRRILHQAYERTFQERFLKALHAEGRPQAASQEATTPDDRPPFQAAFCIDEREESFRRHLEEICPAVETFGAAGFFNVPIAFRPASEERPVPLCPVVLTPRHLVTEEEQGAPKDLIERAARSLTSKLPRYLHLHGRSLWLGQVMHLAGGALGALEMLIRTAFPGLTLRMAHWGDTVHGKGRGSLHFVREDQDSTAIPSVLGDLTAGFTAEEMADRVAGLLRTIGLTRRFGRLVFVIGHGSTTNNNPFASAYECGACGGRRGDRNGRIFALMANRPDVRDLLKLRGVEIPHDTVFVGACHDTCADRIDYFDGAMLPATHKQDLEEARRILDLARTQNAHERCRRFANAKGLDPRAALSHVEQRSFNMREPRPEYGHGSNAACVVGRRDFTRGLFLDRRSFLVSYDWRHDATGKILEAILAAVMPVCSGISLEYYFSRVDNRRYGAGTKLPHNVVSMLGVMDGLSSDLRTGLPWQTVEIHEAMRLFTVIEAPLERIRAALGQLTAVANMLEKRWIVLAYSDPVTHACGWITPEGSELYTGKDQKIPIFTSSKAYYQGVSEHLKPAWIRQDLSARPTL